MTMKSQTLIALASAIVTVCPASAEENPVGNDIREHTATVEEVNKKISAWDRLHVGGYGEAVYSRYFYSDNYLRYTQPENFKNEKHGRFDIPHVVIYLGYDFGKGWSMSSEIEFEHGGVESAVEIETEEAGEYETEVERGGEVNLEQFYIQKEFFPQLKVRAGLQIIPVGGTNARHEPNQFFGVYRPEGREYNNALHMARSINIGSGTSREMGVSTDVHARTGFRAFRQSVMDTRRLGLTV